MTVQFILLLVSSSLCYNYYDYFADDYDNSDLQYVSHETLTVLLGSSFSLSCHGEPSSQLYHQERRYEGPGSYNETTSSHLIPAASSEHTGTWHCGDSQTHLAVIPEREVTVIVLQDRVVVGEGEVVTVTEDEVLRPLCVTVRSTKESLGDRQPAFWRVGADVFNKSEVMVRLDGEGREHVMLSLDAMVVRREDNEVVMECSLQGERASLVLEVEYPPQFTISRQPNFGTPIVTQSSVSLLCTVDSRPASEVFWERDGKVVSREAELRLEGVTVEQQGWYQCNANHKLGNYSSVGYYLTVKEAEDIPLALPCLASSEQPTVMTPQHNISTTRGQNVTIYSKYCSSLPPILLAWSGPNVLIKQGETKGRFRTTVVGRESENCTTLSLVVGEVTTSDTGLYLLVVSSQAGAGQGMIWVEVGPGEERVVASSVGRLGLYCDTLLMLVLVTLLLPGTCYQ